MKRTLDWHVIGGVGLLKIPGSQIPALIFEGLIDKPKNDGRIPAKTKKSRWSAAITAIESAPSRKTKDL